MVPEARVPVSRHDRAQGCSLDRPRRISSAGEDYAQRSAHIYFKDKDQLSMGNRDCYLLSVGEDDGHRLGTAS